MIDTYLDLARAHAPMLAMAVLLIGAGVSALLPARAGWVIACLVVLAALFLVSDAALRALVGRSAIHGAPLAFNAIAAFAAPLLVALMVMVLPASGAALGRGGAHSASVGLALCVGAGWVGALLATDLVGLVAGAHIAWLAAVAAVALSADRQRGALNGALRMLIAGGVGAALMWTGVALFARAVGSDAASLASGPITAPNLATVGIVLMMLPIAGAAGLAPLHSWVGPAFGRGGGLAVLMIGVVAAIGAMFVLARLAALATSAPDIALGVDAALVLLGAASIVIGSAQAIGARDLRRLAAYAGATQAGCVMLALALGSPAGFAAALVQVFAWAAASLALLGGALALKSADLNALDGLVRRAPLAAAAITAGALSLMGAPLTIGFLGRWRLIEASVGAGWWWAAGMALAASLAAVFYGGRLIERIYFRRADNVGDQDLGAWRWLSAPALLAAIAAIAFGLAPTPLLNVAARAAAMALEQGL